MDLKYLRYLIALLLPLVAQAQDTTIDDYPSSGVPATNDLLYLLDVDDTNDGPKGSNKKLTIANLLNVQPQYGPTGVLTGGVLSTGAGATEFSISDGTGIITTAGGARTAVSWSGKSNITPANIATNLLTWVAIDSGGNVVESTTPFTATQQRTNIVLGVVVHVDKATVDNVNNEQHIAYQGLNTTYDLADAIGFINVSGNVFTANGANLNINKSEGVMFKMGANYNNDTTNPHNRTLAALSPATFQYRFNDGSNGVTGTTIDADNLDNGAGGLTAVGSNKWSIQRIYSFVSNNVKIQRGVADYATLTAAVDGIASEAYVTEQSIADNGLLRGWLVVKKGATDLSDPAVAKFISAPKFGEGTAETASAAGAFAASSTTAIVPTTAIVLDEATGNEVALSLDYTVNKATSGDDTGLKINMTDTASPGTSLLADFQTGGVSKFSVSNSGSVTNLTKIEFPASELGKTLIELGFSNYGIGFNGNGEAVVYINGNDKTKIGNSVSTEGWFGLTSTLGGADDVLLYRDAAGILAQRNGTNDQEFRIYNTYTDASNGEWLEIGFQDTANTAVIKTNANGSGTVRDLSIDAPLVGIGTTSPSSVLDVDGTVETKVYTVSTLPSAAVPGQMAFVSDSSVAHAGNSGAIVAGSGSTTLPVYSDGTNWRIH